MQPNQIGMTWQYTIEWHDTSSHGINSHRKSIVVVTSKPRSQSEKQLIQIKTWTSKPEMAENPAEIVLFARVMRGDSPVIGAKVMASVSLESTNNASVVTLSPVRLHDNGYGGERLLNSETPFKSIFGSHYGTFLMTYYSYVYRQ